MIGPQSQEVVSRTPQGVRGLKFPYTCEKKRIFCRTPQGVRGLKFFDKDGPAPKEKVAPRMGRVD